MVQTKQGRTSRPNPKGSRLYKGEVLAQVNSGTVARLDTKSVRGQVYTRSPKRERKNTRWKGAKRDSAKSRIAQSPPPASETGDGIKLHLGCGNQNWDGFIDVDDYPAFDVKPDLKCSITDLPYDDNTVDEIWLIHVFEHIYLWEAEDALEHWFKILKPGGKLVIEVPCMDKILDLFNKGVSDVRMTFYGIFGEQIEGMPEMAHRWCYSKAQLSGMFESIGFKHELKDPIYHIKQRDIRIEGIKP